jgi:hypothetical protein
MRKALSNVGASCRIRPAVRDRLGTTYTEFQEGDGINVVERSRKNGTRIAVASSKSTHRGTMINSLRTAGCSRLFNLPLRGITGPRTGRRLLGVSRPSPAKPGLNFDWRPMVRPASEPGRLDGLSRNPNNQQQSDSIGLVKRSADHRCPNWS